MKGKTLNRRTIIKFTVVIYIFSSLLVLGFIGERNYRKSLLNYGFQKGNEYFLHNIYTQVKQNPCREIVLEKDNENIVLIESNCEQINDNKQRNL